LFSSSFFPSFLFFLAYLFSSLSLLSFFSSQQASQNYFPVIYFDFFWLLSDRLLEINETVSALPLELVYSPIGIWKFRIELSMEESWKMQENFASSMGGTSSSSGSSGSGSSDTDALKAMIMNTNIYLLVLTFAVSTLHMVFDFLAFKNDIAFWFVLLLLLLFFVSLSLLVLVFLSLILCPRSLQSFSVFHSSSSPLPLLFLLFFSPPFPFSQER
jgi:hypothetical protein